MAEAMIETGVLRAEHFSGQKPLKEIVHAAFQGLINSYSHQWKVWPRHMNLCICDVLPENELQWYESRRDNEESRQDGAFIGSTSRDDITICAIGPALEKIQKKWPGVGQTIAHLLHLGCWNSFGCFGPNEAYGTAQFVSWMGHSTDKELIKELRTPGFEYTESELEESKHLTDDAFAELNDLFTKKKFDSIYSGDWAYLHCIRKLRSIPTEANYQPGEFRGVIRAAQELHTCLRPYIREKKRAGQSGDAANLNRILEVEASAYHCAPIMLRWDDDDYFCMLFDKSVNGAFEAAEPTDEHFAIRFNSNDVKSCERAITDLVACLHIATLTDYLIQQLCPSSLR